MHEMRGTELTAANLLLLRLSAFFSPFSPSLISSKAAIFVCMSTIQLWYTAGRIGV
jgi:hypothetical protein